MPFNPNDHMMQLSGKQYLKVAGRIMWFREEHPDGFIHTDHIEITDERAVFRAVVTKEVEGGMATGYGSETLRDFKDYIEKAETKAIGRALAALGFGTQFAPELDEGDRIVDTPQSPRSRPQPAPNPRAPANERRAPQSAPEPPIDREKVIHRLHSYVPHDALHTWAASQGLASLINVSTNALVDLGKSFKAGGATAFMAQHAPPAGQSSIDGLDDLHAQLDRDKIAERARQ